MSNKENNNRIVKNTFLLYARMLFVMAINLYTSRVVLDALGVVDFGLYNVVGGVVAMFTFISAAMSNSTLRFITFSLGQSNQEGLQKTFNTAFQIHVLISLIILILAETVGLWFLHNKMVIPEERFLAARWVYQLSILSCLSTIIVVPYISLIKAHEQMGAFAVISILDVILKLAIAFVIQWTGFDRLVFYGALLLFIHLLNLVIYWGYCIKHYNESKIRFIWDKPLFTNMVSFAGWSLIGNMAWMGYTQGLNILLNMFFGPAVNAARGVAVQVQNAVKGFVTNFQTAINPQITKSYAVGDLNRTRSLVFTGSKLSYYMLSFFVVPLICEAGPILSIWLKEVPEHSISFMRLVLLVLLIDPLANPIGIANNATGDIRNYQIIEGGLLLLIVPISYLFLKLGYSPESVFVVQFVVSAFVQLVRVILVRKKLNINVMHYLIQVILPIVIVTSLVGFVSYAALTFLGQSLFEILLVMAVSCLAVILFSFLIGLNKQEKNYVQGLVRSFLKKH